MSLNKGAAAPAVTGMRQTNSGGSVRFSCGMEEALYSVAAGRWWGDGGRDSRINKFVAT